MTLCALRSSWCLIIRSPQNSGELTATVLTTRWSQVSSNSKPRRDTALSTSGKTPASIFNQTIVCSGGCTTMAGSPCSCRTSLRPGSSSSTASSGCSSWPTTTTRSTWRPGTWPACFPDSGEVIGSLILALMESLFQDRIRRRDSGSGGDPKGVAIDEGRVWRADQRHRYRRGRAPEGEGEDKQVLFGEDRNITYLTLMLLRCLYPQTRSNPLLMLFLFPGTSD